MDSSGGKMNSHVAHDDTGALTVLNSLHRPDQLLLVHADKKDEEIHRC